ncbi:MAG: tRNA 2-selenouridine(34) synthase MnmH [Taibaiella sp.]|nr:tRNA 2-selenouridine(34) synthase MnmH [Taibaiella sp.]
MATRIQIEEFLLLAQQHPVLDVRSPGEYFHACIPSAISFPLFTDEERKVVGTTYKQQSRENAIKIGLDYFGPKMRTMVEEAERIAGNDKTILVHCWRGGMRSAAIAWLLDLYGFKVYTLAGGYKAFRQWVLLQFGKPFRWSILGGYTGSGKTVLLEELVKRKQQVIDLEALANHKGSAFGALGRGPQPSQEMFENMLALKLAAVQPDRPVWIEDESRRIGNLNIPADLWSAMRASPVFFMDIPAEARLQHILSEYGKFKKEDLVSTIMRIRKRLGGLATRDAINHLLDDNIEECFRILLRYYDKFYGHGLTNRDNVDGLLTTVTSDVVNAVQNAGLLIESTQQKQRINE